MVGLFFCICAVGVSITYIIQELRYLVVGSKEKDVQIWKLKKEIEKIKAGVKDKDEG